MSKPILADVIEMDGVPVNGKRVIWFSEESYEHILEMIKAKAEPSPKLRELMSREPRYKKEF